MCGVYPVLLSSSKRSHLTLLYQSHLNNIAAPFPKDTRLQTHSCEQQTNADSKQNYFVCLLLTTPQHTPALTQKDQKFREPIAYEPMHDNSFRRLEKPFRKMLILWVLSPSSLQWPCDDTIFGNFWGYCLQTDP